MLSLCHAQFFAFAAQSRCGAKCGHITDKFNDESERFALDRDHSVLKCPTVDQCNLVKGRISSISAGLARQRQGDQAEIINSCDR